VFLEEAFLLRSPGHRTSDKGRFTICGRIRSAMSA
jgi:hypothetical protein